MNDKLRAAAQEACSVCNEVHSILDADESQIIRDTKDGYPEGRTPRVLTLQERVTALCRYASDWKRWYLDRENTAPPRREWVGLTQTQVKLLREGVHEESIKTGDSIDWIFYTHINEALKEKNT